MRMRAKNLSLSILSLTTFSSMVCIREAELKPNKKFMSMFVILPGQTPPPPSSLGQKVPTF